MKFEIYNFNWNENHTNKLKFVQEKTQQAIKFYNLENWSFSYDNAKRRAGRCSYTKRKISLSKHFVELNNFQLIEQTIRHEIAHALNYIHFKQTGHGITWQRISISIGDDGKRCYDSNLVKMPERTIKYKCPNCEKLFGRFKKTRKIFACTSCCVKFNNGKFSDKFKLELVA